MPKAPITSVKKLPVAHAATAGHLPFSDIGGDAIILKDGSARAVLEVTPICLAGYTEQEQAALSTKYAAFLNQLTDPVQVLVKSKMLDMDGYLTGIRDRETSEDRPFFRTQLKEYRELLEKFLPYSGYGIMDRRTYLVIAFELPTKSQQQSDPLSGIFRLLAPNRVLRDASVRAEHLSALRNGLNDAVTKVLDAFEPVGLPIRRLATRELIELFVRVYHPGTSDHAHDALFASLAPALPSNGPS